MTDRARVTVEENAAASRYEALTEGGVVAGFADYVERGGVRVLTHTEVDDAFEGQGVGSALVRGALDDLRSRGLPVRVTCPFTLDFIARHPEYADLTG